MPPRTLLLLPVVPLFRLYFLTMTGTGPPAPHLYGQYSGESQRKMSYIDSWVSAEEQLLFSQAGILAPLPEPYLLLPGIQDATVASRSTLGPRDGRHPDAKICALFCESRTLC